MHVLGKFLLYLHDLTSDCLILTAIEEASLASIEVHGFWKERYDFESPLLDDVIDLREVRIYSVNIPEWEAHDDASAKICMSKSSKKITVHGGELASLRLDTIEGYISRIHHLTEISFAHDV